MYFVYMLRCRGGSLYTGIAADMEKRLRQHASRRRGLRKIHAGAPARGPCRTLSGGGPRSRCTAGSADQDASAHKKRCLAAGQTAPEDVFAERLNGLSYLRCSDEESRLNALLDTL